MTRHKDDVDGVMMSSLRNATLEGMIDHARHASDAELCQSVGYRPDDIDPAKRDALLKFFSNLDKPVALMMPGILSGAFGSMSSRTPESLRKRAAKFMDEDEKFAQGLQDTHVPDFVNELGIDFFRRVYAEYGDDSIAQMVPLAMIEDDVSLYHAMGLLHHRLVAGIEKSTRYRAFDKKFQGSYPYVVDPVVKQAGLEAEFREAIDGTFDLYAAMRQEKEGLGARVMEQLTKKVLQFEVFRAEVERAAQQRGWAAPADEELSTAYKSTIRAMHLDTVRHALPLAARTLLALQVNAQNVRDLLVAGYARQTGESVALTELLRREVSPVIGTLIGDLDIFSEHSDKQEQKKLRDRAAATINFRAETSAAGWGLLRTLRDVPTTASLIPTEPKKDGVFGLYDVRQYTKEFVRVTDPLYGFEIDMVVRGSIDSILAGIIAERHPLASLDQAWMGAQHLSSEQKRQLVLEYAGIGNDLRQNRRQKPGRAFERMDFDISLKLPLGEIRDVRRHRILTNLDQERFEPGRGFFIAPALREAGLEMELETAYNALGRMSERLAEQANPWVASLALPLASFQQMHLSINARELHHILELRTQPGAHINYKRACQMMYVAAREFLPILDQTMLFLDRSTEVDYGRGLQELRTRRKVQ